MAPDPKPAFSDPTREPHHAALLAGQLTDPFAYLGPHDGTDGRHVRVFQPGAHAVEVIARDGGALLGQLTPVGEDGVFAGEVSSDAPYCLRIHWPESQQETEDPYSFGPVLGELDLHLFSEGTHWNLAERLGAAATQIDGVPGVRFAVWAPNARRVSVVGDFNLWDGRRHPMRLRHSAGVWELFVPRLGAGTRYKYEIVAPTGQVLPQRADPLARATERPPATASIVPHPSTSAGRDADWMAERAGAQCRHGADLDLRSACRLLAQAGRAIRAERSTGRDWPKSSFPMSAIWASPISNLCRSWSIPSAVPGAISRCRNLRPARASASRMNSRHFVDACHRAGLGVILDWVPGHFPNDPHGLAQFDGTALYEHADPREGFHKDWNTLIYNFGRREVQGFLIASALYWLETFHVDGLRVDAVASMLYRDYSRDAGEWVPNNYGGRENLEAIEFLKRMNAVVAERAPGRDHHRRGIDRLARRFRAAVGRRARLLLQMEHGLDARHAAIYRQGSDVPPVASRRIHLLDGLCL